MLGRTGNRMRLVTAVLALAAASGGAWAQPRIVSLGNNALPTGVSGDGTVIAGTLGSSSARWTVSGGTITPFLTTGTGFTGLSDDGSTALGTVLNTAGLGGLATNATMAARWTLGGGWADLGLILPNPALGVTGSGVSQSSIGTPRDVSATGRFIVGQGYIAPNGSFRFRGWWWDSQAANGAGEMRVLPTSFDSSRNRYKDGRAIAVSADGSVIVGGEDPSSSGGRLLVYRWNSTTSSYDMSYLPDGLTASGQPQTRTVDNFSINAAGTMIAGMTFELNESSVPDAWLARWEWDAGAGAWTRHLLYNTSSNLSISSWWNNPNCPIPPNMIPTGMSDDGDLITGILVYSTCGSFVRGGFVYRVSTGQMSDLYDYLVAQGTPGIEDYAPPGGQGVPRLGWANALSADGRHLVGYGGPFTSIGPGWLLDLDGGACVDAAITSSPTTPTNFSVCSSIILNVAASGSGPIAFQWYKDGAPLADGQTAQGSLVSGATTNRLVITQQKPQDAGQYWATAAGACGPVVASAAAQVQIDPAFGLAANDTCATAQPVAMGTNLLGAGQSPCAAFTPDPTADQGSCLAAAPNADRWFSFTAPATGTYRIETCGSNFDTALSLYSECGGFEIACNDNLDVGSSSGCSSSRSRIGFVDLTGGHEYLIRAAAPATAFLSSSSLLNLSITNAPARPANDSCAAAATAVLGVNAFDTTEASIDGSASCNATASRDVWFRYTATARGALRASTCPGTTWNTVLSAYAGECGAELACNDNAGVSGCTNQSIVTIPVEAGGTYTFRVAGNSASAFGVGQLTLSFSCGADFNGDGFLDFFDYDDYVACFETGTCPAGKTADYNGDGFADFFDYDDFVTDFEVGC